jgi:hypothetical protein
VADCRHNGRGGAEDSIGHNAFVESPEIFEASAAARDNHGVNSKLIGAAIHGINRPSNSGRSGIALHWNIDDQYANKWRAQARGAQYILQGCTRCASDDGDRARVIGKQTLSRIVKVSLRTQCSA